MRIRQNLEGLFCSRSRDERQRHRAFREPTLDSSRMSVRFSFQGPRQPGFPSALGSRILPAAPVSSTSFFSTDSFFSFVGCQSLSTPARRPFEPRFAWRVVCGERPSRMRSPLFQATTRGGVSSASRFREVRASWSTAASPSSDSIKIFSRCIGEIRKSPRLLSQGGQPSPQCQRSRRLRRFSLGSARLPEAVPEASSGFPQPILSFGKWLALLAFRLLRRTAFRREGGGT